MALFPLRPMGIRILNYLDDWLILAQSEDKLLSHRFVLLSHLECLGLRVNFAKRALYEYRAMNIVPGNSYRLNLNEGSSHARTCTGHSAARPSLSQSASKDAGPHGLCVFGTSAGPASKICSCIIKKAFSIGDKGVSPWVFKQDAELVLYLREPRLR